MKYFKTQNVYKASNVVFNPSLVTAYSYNWWKFVDCIDGKIVLNTYNYSNSTIKHRYKVQRVMNELGITPDLELPCPKGLQELESALPYLTKEIKTREEYCNRPRVRDWTKLKLRKEILALMKQLAEVTYLIQTKELKS